MQLSDMQLSGTHLSDMQLSSTMLGHVIERLMQPRAWIGMLFKRHEGERERHEGVRERHEGLMPLAYQEASGCQE